MVKVTQGRRILNNRAAPAPRNKTRSIQDLPLLKKDKAAVVVQLKLANHQNKRLHNLEDRGPMMQKRQDPALLGVL